MSASTHKLPAERRPLTLVLRCCWLDSTIAQTFKWYDLITISPCLPIADCTEYSRRDVLRLFEFIDWVMILPEGFKQAFWLELKAYDEERKVPYITSVEEIGFERGVQQGRQEECRSLIILFLEQRIGQLPDGLRDRLTQLDLLQLEALAVALLNFSTLAELEAWLESRLE